MPYFSLHFEVGPGCSGLCMLSVPRVGAVRTGSREEKRDASDSCPTLCCLVLASAATERKEMALDTVVSKFLQR